MQCCVCLCVFFFRACCVPLGFRRSATPQCRLLLYCFSRKRERELVRRLIPCGRSLVLLPRSPSRSPSHFLSSTVLEVTERYLLPSLSLLILHHLFALTSLIGVSLPSLNTNTKRMPCTNTWTATHTRTSIRVAAYLKYKHTHTFCYALLRVTAPSPCPFACFNTPA